MGKLTCTLATTIEFGVFDMNDKQKYWILAWLSVVLGVVGLTIIILEVGWLTAIAIYIVLLGNNISVSLKGKL